MFGPAAIEDSPGKVAAIRTALKAFFPDRVHKTTYLRGFDEHDQHELQAGVLMLVTGGESDFSQRLGMTAREGTLSLILVMQFEVPNDTDGESVEAEELAISEQIKNFVRAGVSGIELSIEQLYHSAQQETPYGYVVAQLNAGPPRATTH